MSTKIVQVKPLTLSSNIGTSNTTAIISGMIGLDGVDLTQADFGIIIYGTFEPNTTREEAVSFTITSNTAGVANINFTASGRGLLGKSPYGTGGITYTHSAGAKLVISNNPNLFNKFTAKDNAEVVTAQWQFPTPTGNSSPATKAYADALVSLGAPEATALARGISILSASPNVTIGTATVSVATPAVISFIAHGLIAGDSSQLTTTGALPTGLSPSTTYFVIATGLVANSFQISLTLGGAAINTTGTQSGVHTLIKVTPIAVSFNDTTKLPTASEKLALAGGGALGTPGSGNKFLTELYPVVANNINFGDGSDGDVTISGATTLTRDMFYNNLTVTSTLNTDGYRIFVKGTLSGTGTIANNNTTAGGIGGTGAAFPGSAGPAKGSGIWKGVAGLVGGDGGDSSPLPTPGGVGINGSKGVNGATGGNGGNGSSGGGAAGGAGGANDNTKPILEKFNAINFAFYSAAATFAQYSLTGSGSGGGANGQNAVGSGGSGGGSGGSGGVIIIFAKIWAGNFTISATGANGGNGGAGALNNTGGGGGGGGGTGGTIVVVYGTKTWSGPYVLTGGTGGSGGALAGTGTNGTSGATGATGVFYEYSIASLI